MFYTVYLNATDEVVALGTSAECAKQMGKSVNCFHSLVSKNRKGIQKKYTVIIEKEDQDSSDDLSCQADG